MFLSRSFVRFGGSLGLSGEHLPYTVFSHSGAIANEYRFPSMFESVGIAASSGVGVALIVGVSAVPTIFLHWKGRVWRKEKTDV